MSNQFQEEFQKNFHSKQALLNVQTVRKKRREYDKPNKIMHFSPVQDGTSEPDMEQSPPKEQRKANESYAQLLKDQISMHKIADETELSKSRRIDQQNVAYNKEQYPFGFEGVKVRDDVIEKYKASNYAIQSNMLSKFQKEAEEFRKNKVRKYQKDHNVPAARSIVHTVSPQKQLDNFSYISLMNQKQLTMQKRLQLQLIRQKQREEEEERKRQKAMRRAEEKRRLKQFFLKRQKQNMVKVGNMLREIDYKLKENSSKMADSLRELRSGLRQNQKITDVKETALLERIARMNEQSKSSSKIPVVMYNDRYYDARVFYAEAGRGPERINRSDIKADFQGMQGLLKILKKNDERLQHLTQESEGSPKYTASSYR